MPAIPESPKTALAILVELSACSEGIEWSSQFGTDTNRAWTQCPRGDWLLWYAGKISGPPESESRRKVVFCACQCARLALPYVVQGDGRPLEAIAVAERWARGEAGVSGAQVEVADGVQGFAAAAAAVVASVAAKIPYASYAAAAAAYAANAAALTPNPASYAASAAAYAADAATSGAISSAAAAYATTLDAANVTQAGLAARHKVRALCREIVMRHYPAQPFPGR